MQNLGSALALGAFAASLALPNVAVAADPTGEWLVKDKLAIIRIENCDGAMWGVNSWERQPGTDDNNPDAKKRGRPTLGMAVILGMKPTKTNKWEGQIYNPQDGKTYDASISLASPDVLTVRGCVLGFLCGGEDWTRVKAEAKPTTGSKPPAGAKADPSATKPKTPKEVCASIAELSPPPGSAMQGSAQPARPAPKR